MFCVQRFRQRRLEPAFYPWIFNGRLCRLRKDLVEIHEQKQLSHDQERKRPGFCQKKGHPMVSIFDKRKSRKPCPIAFRIQQRNIRFYLGDEFRYIENDSYQGNAWIIDIFHRLGNCELPAFGTFGATEQHGPPDRRDEPQLHEQQGFAVHQRFRSAQVARSRIRGLERTQAREWQRRARCRG